MVALVILLQPKSKRRFRFEDTRLIFNLLWDLWDGWLVVVALVILLSTKVQIFGFLDLRLLIWTLFFRILFIIAIKSKVWTYPIHHSTPLQQAWMAAPQESYQRPKREQLLLVADPAK